MSSERKRLIPYKISERQLTDENLVVGGWGCSDCNQQWLKNGKNSLEYFQALELFRQHVQEGSHGAGSHITWLYLAGNSRVPDNKNFSRTRWHDGVHF